MENASTDSDKGVDIMDEDDNWFEVGSDRVSDRDAARDIRRDKIRDNVRDLARDKERDELRDRLRDIARDEERDKWKDQRRIMAEAESPQPLLTVEKVLEVFKRIKSVNTPDINNKLALPYKKPPVKDSNLFKQEYAEVKENIWKISGGKGKSAYQEEKKRQTSLPFMWPAPNLSPDSPAQLVEAGADGRDSAPRLPVLSPVSPCYEAEIAKVTTRIQAMSTELVKKEEQIATLKQKLKEKETAVRSYVKENLDLKRKLQVAAGSVVGGEGAGSDDESGDEIERRVAPQGPKQKTFSALGNYQKRVASKKVVESLKEISETCQIDPKQMAGYILKRVSYESDKKLAETGSKIEKGESVSSLRKLEKDHCLWLLTSGEGMGKFLWRKMKTSLKDFVSLEAHESLSSHWKEEILAPIKDIHEENNRDIQVGVLFDPALFIPLYLKRFLMRQEKEGNPLPLGGHFKIVLKAGTDGGRHGWFRWKSGPVPAAKNPTQSISLYDLMLLSVESAPGFPDYEWREQKPCSDKVTRVLSILMAEEKTDILTKMVLYLQKQQNLLTEGFSVIYKGENYIFFPKFVDRNDKKMDRILSGIGDGCDNCLAAPKLWCDLTAVEAGFPLDRTLETVKETYENLKKDAHGEIVKTTGDYEVRQGVCGKPISLRETFSFTLTHKWMHALHHVVKVITHLMVSHTQWVETAEVKGALKAAKEKIQESLRPGKVPGGSEDENIGVAYEFPDAKGYGGTTTTAQTARTVFQSTILRQRLVEMCPPQYQQAMAQILLNNLTLLSIMSCDKLLDVSKVDELCKQQMRLLLLDIGPWVRVTPTIHELYAHLPDLIEENGRRGLKAMSEENLEALHKVVRSIRERKARLISVGANLRDILTRMTIRSDPVVQFFEPQVKCNICGGLGHSQVTCEYSSDRSGAGMRHEDFIFWQYVDPSEQPAWFI